MLIKLITPKAIVAATVAGCLVAAAGVGFIGYQSYAKVQDEARVELESANSSVAAALDDYEFRVSVLETELANAQATLDGSAGKTLDETARAELEESIASATDALERAERAAQELSDRVREVNASFEEQLLWPPNALESAESLADATEAISSDVVKATDDLMKDTQAVVTAQAAWQAEQDRIAAEAAAKAAAEAAARRAAAGGNRPLSPSGGSTQPIAQTAPPPPPSATPATLVSFAESYLRQYVPLNQAGLAWDPTLCAAGYICGTTTVGVGTPLITLMGTEIAPANYDFPGGRYVLVHEAAHAKQYWLYGSVSGMINGLLSFAPPAPPNWGYSQGIWAVEYMADCSTQSQLGTTGTYMRMVGVVSCSPEQLQEASRVW